NKDTMRYEEQITGSGAGWGYLKTGSTTNDTTNVDAGYTAELRIDLDKLGYAVGTTSIQLTAVIFDADGFQHPMNSWDHSVGSFYKSWWGSEWGGVYRTLRANLTTGVGAEDGAAIPTVFALGQNFPNPFNPATTFSFDLPVQSRVALKVYDMLGREVTTIVESIMAPGSYRMPFDAGRLSSGVYLYRLTADPADGAGSPFTSVRRFVLLK
ncbi:MAG: T9SS type A sorting domain-containing protein, partial [Bacteroidetes bacterium]|nr:T9SS type A sorting domain-containing protein [Bacteroidota bacterium]